jgi:hypothetical protein
MRNITNLFLIIRFWIYIFRDLNTELEMMKQLLKEIVTRITDNLLGKSSNGLDTDGQSRRTHSDTHSVKKRNNLILRFIYIFD